jgi:Phytanoyl-CoA dioxygenase (PhyH)
MAQRLVHPEPAHAEAGLRAAVIRWRLQQAHERVARRRERLAHWLDGVDAATFARNGFIVKRQALAPEEFESLCAQAQALRAPAREMMLGDCVTRHIALDAGVQRAAPALAQLLVGRRWSGLTRYVAASNRAPRAFLQTLITHARPTLRDPQTLLHSDAPEPTMKAWYFLNDVDDADGPLCYVPGSHRLTAARLAWEVHQQLHPADMAAQAKDAGPPRRIDKSELSLMGLGHPERLVVPANTLIVADTFGFHKRAQARHPTMRLELWARSGAPAAQGGWAGDLAERLGAAPNPWRDRGPMPADVLPHWKPQDPACTDARHGVY